MSSRGILISLLLIGLCCTHGFGSMLFAFDRFSQRLNFGAIFQQRVNKAKFAQGYWKQTFAFKLTEINNNFYRGALLDKILNQGNYKKEDQINQLPSALSVVTQRQLHIMEQKFRNRYNELLKDILTIIPDSSNNNRNKRSTFIDFSTVGRWFGLASNKDLMDLSEIAAKMAKTNKQWSQKFVSEIDKLQSTTAINTLRLLNLTQALQLTRKGLLDLFVATNKTVTQLYSQMTFLFQWQLNYQDFISNSAYTLNVLKSSLLNCLGGNLSPELIKPKVVTNVINNIRSILQDKFPNFKLSLTLADFYKLKHFAVIRYGNTIYIQIILPIEPRQGEYILNDLTTFPLIHNENSSIYTKLAIADGTILAINLENSAYITFHKSFLADCYYNEVFYQCRGITFNTFAHKTCELALFQNDQELVRQLCIYNVILQKPSPKVLALGNLHYVVSFLPKINLACKSQSVVIKGCLQPCLLQLKYCTCNIQIDSMVLLAGFSQCKHDGLNFTMLHSFNLISMLYVNNLTQFNFDIPKNELMLSPYTPMMPNLTFYKSKLDALLPNDGKLELSLSQLLESNKNNSVIYTNKYHHLENELVSFKNSQSSDSHTYVIYAWLAILTISTGLTYYKLYFLTVLATPVSSLSHFDDSLMYGTDYDSTTFHPFVENMLTSIPYANGSFFVFILLLYVFYRFLGFVIKTFGINLWPISNSLDHQLAILCIKENDYVKLKLNFITLLSNKTLYVSNFEIQEMVCFCIIPGILYKVNFQTKDEVLLHQYQQSHSIKLDTLVSCFTMFKLRRIQPDKFEFILQSHFEKQTVFLQVKSESNPIPLEEIP